MEYDSNTNKFDVFYEFSMEDDIDEIFYNAHDKILFYSEKIMKNNEYYYKFHCIDVRS